MRLLLNPDKTKDYETFLKIKRLPVFSFTGREAWFPDEYAELLGLRVEFPDVDYQPRDFLWDYQADMSRVAIRKRKFAAFWDCGLGKTLLYFEYIRHVHKVLGSAKGILMVAPLMVIDQLLEEAQRFYGDELPFEIIEAKDLPRWAETCGGKLGITNYEAIRETVPQGKIGCLILEESSILKSHYGKWGYECIRLGKGLHWKLCGTGTPAPNDRIEYANHAVFLDHFPNVNSFLARYFVNRGETNERWELKPHALQPFYRSLSHWSHFLTNPATYGWKDNCQPLPPINVHIHDVEMTTDQTRAIQQVTGYLPGVMPDNVGGINSRAKFSKIAKGLDGSATLKYEYIEGLMDSWRGQSTIIWCWYNDEQDMLAARFPEAANIDGSTPHAKRLELIHDFKAGRRKILISKAKVLGFGLNLQIARKHVFSSLIDSYEKYYQCIKRSNRYGSTEPLDVHIPLLSCERPMAENVLRKARQVDSDTKEQERIFKEMSTVV